MASGSGKESRGRKPSTWSPEAGDRLAFEVDVVLQEDAEAISEAQRLADARASLQRRFHEDRNAALEWVTEAGDPALVPMLVDVLQDEAITHFHMAEALEQITDEPDRTWAIEIKRSEKAQVASFPRRAVTSVAEDDKIRELVEEGELRKALQINRARASELIAEDAKIALRHSHANTLTRLLREQARVQAFMALALARIAEEPQQESRAIEILFAEAAQLSSDRETLCFILRSLQSFKALTVIPGLIAYLQKADDGPPRDAALETLEHLILHDLAADASDAAARGRDLTLRFFVALLGGAALDQQEQVTVAGIVLRCAGPLWGGLDAVIGRMAELSNVTIEEMGLRVCGRVLAHPGEIDAAERTDAAGWIHRHLLGEHAAIPTYAVASAAPTSEGSLEPPRAPVHFSLTEIRSPGQTSLVSRMDVSQGNSTAAPSPEAVEADQLDLASESFTTEDPVVLRTRVLLVESAEELSQLDVFEHGKRLRDQVDTQCETIRQDVQAYLDRLVQTDFSKFSIPQKEQLAAGVNWFAQPRWYVIYPESVDPNRVTVSCFVPNERSKGSIRLRSGSTPVYTGRTWPDLQVVPSSRIEGRDEQ